MADHTFRVTFQQQLAMMIRMLIVYGVLLFIYFYYYGFGIETPYQYIFLFFFLLDICPALLVHIQYLTINKGAALVINTELKTINYTTRKESFLYHFDDIELLRHVASFGGGAWYSFSEYRYYRIVFKDKKEIVITCLMVKDIKNTLEMLLRMKAQKKLKVVAFVGH